MMKTINKMIMMFVYLLLPIGAGAQDTHWTVDPYAFQYDMTAYVALSINDEPFDDLRGCEIAAFCGDECRGVSQIQSVEKDGKTIQYAYLRIRSNSSEGEDIKFKVYMASMSQEFEVEDVNVTFQSQQAVGLPSSPMMLNLNIEFMLGDTNGDWRISIADAVAIVDYILSDGKTPLIVPAADMNGDKRVSIADAVAIVDYILSH